MLRSRLFTAGAAIALVGLVLFVVETARALSGNVLGTLEIVLTWVGVGLMAVGGQLLTLHVFWLNRTPLDGGQPTDG